MLISSECGVDWKRYSLSRMSATLAIFSVPIAWSVKLGRSAVVQRTDLPASIGAARPAELPPIFDGVIVPIREVQRRYGAWVFEQMAGNKTRAAERLGVDVKTLAKWLSDDGEPPS